ncbi:MAG: flagellar motor protein MotB [Desulfobacterales bacterium]
MSRDQLESELEVARRNSTAWENRYLEAKAENKTLEQDNTDLSENLLGLQQQNAYLQKMNGQLYDNVVKLEGELKHRKSVIRLQEEVIKLLDDPNNTIASSLKNRITEDSVEVVTTETGVKVVILEKLLYDSGSCELNPEGRQLLKLLAQSLKQGKHQRIVVEGHTDNVPLKAAGKQIPLYSNWELSAVRAARVAWFLEQEGLNPKNLSARGYAFYHPIASNDTPEGRQQNRRIEIILGGPASTD